MKNKVFFLFGLFLLCILVLSSCYKEDRYQIPVGTFEYKGDSVDFYNDLYIDDLTITFTEISEETYLESNHMNVIKNHYDATYFSVDFMFRYSSEEEAKQYSFEYLGKEGDHNDTYKIILNIDNDNVGISGNLIITMEFLSEIGKTTDIGSYAGRIYLNVRGNQINGSEDDEHFKTFPENLYYIESNS